MSSYTIIEIVSSYEYLYLGILTIIRHEYKQLYK